MVQVQSCSSAEIDRKKASIVAEVSKSWLNCKEVVPGSGLLSQRFEMVIEHNLQRGYRLASWKFRQVSVAIGSDACMTETIIAVFDRIDA